MANPNLPQGTSIVEAGISDMGLNSIGTGRPRAPSEEKEEGEESDQRHGRCDEEVSEGRFAAFLGRRTAVFFSRGRFRRRDGEDRDDLCDAG